jgi:hypothetical protein
MPTEALFISLFTNLFIYVLFRRVRIVAQIAVSSRACVSVRLYAVTCATPAARNSAKFETEALYENLPKKIQIRLKPDKNIWHFT